MFGDKILEDFSEQLNIEKEKIKFKDLKLLEEVTIYFNEFDYNIMQYFSNVKDLELSVSLDKKIDNLNFLSNYHNLERLTLELSCDDYTALKNTNITSLHLIYNIITEDDLNYLPNSLEFLKIEKAHFVKDLSNISKSAPNLTNLQLRSCSLVDNLAFINELKNLNYFICDEMPCIDQEIYEYSCDYSYFTNSHVERTKEIDNIVNSIITSDMKEEEKVQNICKYVAEKIEYADFISYFANDEPLSTALSGAGVCISYAYLTSILLSRAGITNYMMVSNEKRHGWNLVKVNDEYYYIDNTWLSSKDNLIKFEQKNPNLFIKQSPFVAIGTGMKPVDELGIPKELLKDIIESEKNKNFVFKFANNIYSIYELTPMVIKFLEVFLIVVMGDQVYECAKNYLEANEKNLVKRKKYIK